MIQYKVSRDIKMIKIHIQREKTGFNNLFNK